MFNFNFGLRAFFLGLNMTRTQAQQAAIEVYCRNMADELNNAGYEFTAFIEHKKRMGYQVPWSQSLFKEQVWKPIQKILLEKQSTTKLDTKEVSQIYEIVNRKMAEIAGISMQFPERDHFA